MRHLVLVAGVFILSCNEQTSEMPGRWLIGTWQNETTQGTIYESWEAVNDSTLSGKSYLLDGDDIVLLEIITLEQRISGSYYIPVAFGQNDDRPVPFELSSATQRQLVFKNTAHDFPQQISYTRSTDDSLIAEISGTVDGEHRVVRFPMVRVK